MKSCTVACVAVIVLACVSASSPVNQNAPPEAADYLDYDYDGTGTDTKPLSGAGSSKEDRKRSSTGRKKVKVDSGTQPGRKLDQEVDGEQAGAAREQSVDKPEVVAVQEVVDGVYDGMYSEYDPRFYGFDPGADRIDTGTEQILTGDHSKYVSKTSQMGHAKEARHVTGLCERASRDEVPKHLQLLSEGKQKEVMARHVNRTTQLRQCCEMRARRARADCVHTVEGTRMMDSCALPKSAQSTNKEAREKCCQETDEEDRKTCFIDFQRSRFYSEEPEEQLEPNQMEQALDDVCERLEHPDTQKSLSLSHLSADEAAVARKTFESRRDSIAPCCTKHPFGRGRCIQKLMTERFSRVCKNEEPLTFGPVTSKRPEYLVAKCCKKDESLFLFCFEEYKHQDEERIKPYVPVDHEERMKGIREEIHACCEAGKEFGRTVDGGAEVNKEDCERAGQEYDESVQSSYKRCPNMFTQCCKTAIAFKRKPPKHHEL